MERYNGLFLWIIEWTIVLIFLVGAVGAVSSSINVNVIETKKLDLTFIPIDDPDSFYIVNDCGCKEVMET